MSTRATYEFCPHDRDRKMGARSTFIYRHHDGYPQGAACWLYEALRQPGGLAEGFLRGSPSAVLTTSHELHGDTEYRYTIRPMDDAPGGYYVKVEEQSWDGDKPKWNLGRESACIAEFIEAVQADWIEDYSPFIKVELGHATRWMTRKAADEMLLQKVVWLGRQAIDKPLSMDDGTAASVRRDAVGLRDALACSASPKAIREALPDA